MADPDNETLVKAYQGTTDPPADDGLIDPAVEADKRTRKRMEQTGEKDYSKAAHHVLDADPDLRHAYVRSYQTDVRG